MEMEMKKVKEKTCKWKRNGKGNGTEKGKERKKQWISKRKRRRKLNLDAILIAELFQLAILLAMLVGKARSCVQQCSLISDTLQQILALGKVLLPVSGKKKQASADKCDHVHIMYLKKARYKTPIHSQCYIRLDQLGEQVKAK